MRVAEREEGAYPNEGGREAVRARGEEETKSRRDLNILNG